MFNALRVIALLLIGFTSLSQEQSLVKWMSFKEAQEANQKQAKPLLIDFYTDWCGWCKHMMKTTYSDPNIAGYINTWFYPVKFDAETHDTIEYQGVKYINRSEAKKSPHDLTLKFLGDKLSYPSTVFVSNNFQFNLLTQGFLEVKKIEPLLVFMVENAFRSSNYDDFSKHFEHTFYDTIFPKAKISWNTFKELPDLEKKKPKKVMVSINTGFCNTCKVMNKTTFPDSVLGAYLNNGEMGFPFHSLALELTRKNFVLPSVVILDENLEILDMLTFYQSPQWMYKVARYFGDNEYKKMKWDEYLKKPEPIPPTKKK